MKQNSFIINRTLALFSMSCFFFIFSLPILARDVLVVEVVDGDTAYTATGEKLRFLGIDTPEMGYYESKDVYIEKPFPFASEAKEYLSSLVLNKNCRLEFDRDAKDSYNRTLAHVFRKKDNLFINKAIVEQGLATVSVYPPNLKYSKELLERQSFAEKAGKNIWSLDIVKASEAYKHIGELRTVRGVVKSVYLSKRYCYLNFADDYKTDFTIGIPKKNLILFKDLPVSVKKWYTGKIVEVTSRIYQRKGPFIQVSLPEQITIVGE